MKTAPASALLLVVSAPSGAGKTTLCNALLERSASLTRAITCTTRAPRSGEIDGVDYHFLSPAAFRRRVAADAFLEHARVHGSSYGTLKSEVLERLRGGRDVLLNIDVQGAASLRTRSARDRELRRALCTIFLAPPSLAALESRLRNRAQDSDEEIRRRLAVARDEMTHWKEFDYLVVSDTVPQALQRLQAILEAEHLRQRRATPPEI